MQAKELREAKASLESMQTKYAQAVDNRGWSPIFDFKPGAWQQHTPYGGTDDVVSYPAMFSCVTLISGDIGKLYPCVEQKSQKIWTETEHAAEKVLLKPNHYQNHIQFKQWWISSKLIHGNAYAYKERDNRGNITGLYLLDPTLVTPLVSENGEVFYRLNEDNLSGLIEGQVVVPASEIIHDRDNCLYHPLMGLPPLYACSISSGLGLKMQGNAKLFFENGSSPGGVLTAPGHINKETADRLKEYWNEGFSGNKSGRIAIAGDGLEYKPMRMSNVDAQMLEILKWTSEAVCSVFHVPAYMVGVGPMPTNNNIEALTQQYYGQCLQKHIESMELCLHEGLEIGSGYRVQLDLDGLFRMDTATLIETLAAGVGAAIHSPDEARERLNLGPVPGGNYPYLQQQNYSLEALAQRDATNPLAVVSPPAPTMTPQESAKILAMLIEKELKDAA